MEVFVAGIATSAVWMGINHTPFPFHRRALALHGDMQ
jgi:hypothetical protein